MLSGAQKVHMQAGTHSHTESLPTDMNNTRVANCCRNILVRVPLQTVENVKRTTVNPARDKVGVIFVL